MLYPMIAALFLFFSSFGVDAAVREEVSFVPTGPMIGTCIDIGKKKVCF